MSFQDTIKSKCTKMMKIYVIPNTVGFFCYMIRSFGLKNADATYQHAMSTIFRDHLRKIMEYYVDDIAIKSHNKNNHVHELRTMFGLMRTHQLKMGPTKSFMEVSSSKFLGFIVTSKRIHLDPDKAIQDMQPPKNLKELGTTRQTGLHP